MSPESSTTPPPNGRRRIAADLAAAVLCLQLAMLGSTAAVADTARAAPTESAPSAAADEAASATITAASLSESALETASPYRFVVQTHGEPTSTQLLLGGLLAAIFLIRNRFRER